MPVRGAASTYCLPKDSLQNLTRYSTAGARRHCSTVSHAVCRYASIIVALVCWIGVEPVLGWRKSPRCNMTTEYECKTGHCIPVDQVCNRRPDCMDGSDEDNCRCVQTWLPPMHRCRNKKCITDFYTCNGKDDCGDGGSDEENCACYGFRCADGTCILSSWRCDGYKDCKDYSDEENCGPLLSGDRRHPFLGLIGPVGCLVAALSIRVLLRSHHRRRLLHSNGETAAAAAVAALEARNRQTRLAEEAAAVAGLNGGGNGGVSGGGGEEAAERMDDSSLGGGGEGGHGDRLASTHWMDRVGAGISSSIAQMRFLFNGQPSASLPPPPPYTETTSISDLPPAYQHGATSAATGIPSVYLLVIPAGKPPPSYNESMSLPDLVQSTGNASQRDDGSPSDTNHFVPISMEEASSSSNPAQSGAQSINAADATVGALASQDFPSPTYGRSRHYQQQRLQFGAYPTSNTPFSLFSANSRPHEVLEFVEDGDDAAIASGSASTSADETLDATAAVGVSVAAAAASPPQECYYRPDGGVTLRQNPLSDEESADDYTHQQDDVESPPSYDDIFNGRSTQLSSPVLTDEPGLLGHRSPVGEEDIQVRVEEGEEET